MELNHFYIRGCWVWIQATVPSGRKKNLLAPILRSPQSFQPGHSREELSVSCSFGDVMLGDVSLLARWWYLFRTKSENLYYYIFKNYFE